MNDAESKLIPIKSATLKHMEEVAIALYNEWAVLQPEMLVPWAELSQSSIEVWMMVAATAMRTIALLPLEIRLACEACGTIHVDVGELATRSHKSHTCQKCGLTWKPANFPTVGVLFLSGSKNE